MCLSWRKRITRMRTLVVSPHLRHQTEQLSRLAEKFSLVRARLPQLEVDQGACFEKLLNVTRKLLLAPAVIPILSWNLQGESDLQEAKELEALHSPASFPCDFIVWLIRIFPGFVSLCLKVASFRCLNSISKASWICFVELMWLNRWSRGTKRFDVDGFPSPSVVTKWNVDCCRLFWTYALDKT